MNKPLKPVDSPPASDEQTLTIKVPIASHEVDVSGGLHVQFHATPAVRRALIRVMEALDKRQAKLANGQRVVTVTHAAQWIVEQLDDHP